MNFKSVVVILFLISVFYNVKGASILALFSSLSYSDHLVYRGYVEALVRMGHHVIVMTPYPGHFRYPELERIVELDVSQSSGPYWDEHKKLLTNVDDYYPTMRKMNELSIKVAVAQLKSQQMSALFINPNVKVDLVITEADMPILYAVAEKYKTPHISITASSGKINMFESKGSPNHILLYPDVNTLNLGKLNVWQKLEEFKRFLRFKYEYYYYHLPLCQMAAEKIFGLKRNLLEVEEDIDMLFISGTQMLLGNRPIVPAITYVDNLHIKPGLPLPQDLQQVLDSSEKGVIYFSLGAVQETESLSSKTVQMMMDALSVLPFKVLFKIGNSTMVKTPNNIYTNIWFPQQQVLAHPNVKAFVTHGGSRSLEEAVFYGVPIVALPIVRTRKVFISEITKHGAGQTVDPYYMDKEQFKKAVMDVATNEKYKIAMMKLRGLTLDNILPGPQAAAWYTDYILRHGGAKHMRSPAVGVKFHKYIMLDIIGYLIGIVLVSLIISYIILRFLIKFILARYRSKRATKGKFKAL